MSRRTGLLTKKDFKLIRFHDGEFKLILLSAVETEDEIDWNWNDKFENGETLHNSNEQLVALMQLDSIISKVYVGSVQINLEHMPYSRQDKAVVLGETDFSNYIHLPHLKIAEVIGHNETKEYKESRTFLDKVWQHAPLYSKIVWPDEGIKERVYKIAPEDNFIHGRSQITMRKTRALDGSLTFEDMTDEDVLEVKHNDCVLVDDIISKGGTFMHAAKELKKAGAKSIKLIVNHSDGVVNKKELFKAGIDEVIILEDEHEQN